MAKQKTIKVTKSYGNKDFIDCIIEAIKATRNSTM